MATVSPTRSTRRAAAHDPSLLQDLHDASRPATHNASVRPGSIQDASCGDRVATAGGRYACAHFQAEQTGIIEAALRQGGWVYRTAYRCLTCGSCFTETHEQTMPRSSSGDAMS